MGDRYEINVRYYTEILIPYNFEFFIRFEFVSKFI